MIRERNLSALFELQRVANMNAILLEQVEASRREANVSEAQTEHRRAIHQRRQVFRYAGENVSDKTDCVPCEVCKH